MGPATRSLEIDLLQEDGCTGMLVTGVYDVVDHSPEGMAEHHWLVVLHACSVVDGPCGTDLEGLVVSQAVLGHDLASLADRVLCHQTHRSHLRSRNEGRDHCWQREGEAAGHVVENLVLEHLRPIPGRFVVASADVLCHAVQSAFVAHRIEGPVGSTVENGAEAGPQRVPAKNRLQKTQVSELRSRLEWRPALRLECPAQRTIVFLEDRPIVRGGLRQELKSELRGLRCGRRGLDCSSDVLHQGGNIEDGL